MGLRNMLFGKKEIPKAETPFQPIDPTEKFMTSQFPALYLKENDQTYHDTYLKKLMGIGFKGEDAERMFEFECNIIRRHRKSYLQNPQFTAMWFFKLWQPVFLEYPKTKEDILII